MKNWKTTLGGILGALGTALTTATDPRVVVAGQVITAAAVLWLGYHAGDR